jgi:mercuric ion transport protein
VAAALAALCCAGTPFIVAGLGALGLSFLRRDAILWPVMIGSLLVALWGFWRGWRVHRTIGPIVLGALAAIALIAGVIFIHGFPAKQLIWLAVLGLFSATAWNFFARRACSI